jgi:hypothetical protein
MSDFAPPSDSGPDPNRWLIDVARSVQGPGMAMQWFGAASLLLAVLGLIVYLVNPDTIFQPVYNWVAREQQKQPPENRTPLPPYKKWVQAQQMSSVIGGLIDLTGSLLITIGGMKMRQVSGYGWAVTGAILSIIPCTNTCCCAGLPIGLWASVALFNSDTRRAFARVGQAGGLDALMASLDPDHPV